MRTKRNLPGIMHLNIVYYIILYTLCYKINDFTVPDPLLFACHMQFNSFSLTVQTRVHAGRLLASVFIYFIHTYVLLWYNIQDVTLLLLLL